MQPKFKQIGCNNYYNANNGLNLNKKTTITIVDGKIEDYRTDSYRIY